MDHIRVLPAPIAAHRAALRRCEVGVAHAAADSDVVAPVQRVGDQFDDHAIPFADHQRRQERDEPAGLRAARLDAIEEDLGAPAVAVGFDAEAVNLRLHLRHKFLLVAFEASALLRRAADDMERAPGQHARHRVEVAGVDIAPQAGRLERNLPRAAERIGDARALPEAQDAELLNEFGEGVRMRAEMPVHRLPDMVVNVGDLFGAREVGNPLAVGRLGEQRRFEAAAFGERQVSAPGDAHMRIRRVAPVNRRGSRQQIGGDGHMLADSRQRNLRQDLSGGRFALRACRERSIVHTHEHLKDVEVALRVVGSGEEAAEDGLWRG